MTMAFEAYLGFSGTTAALHLAGDLEDRDVARLRSLVDQAVQQPVRRFVLHAGELTSLAAAGVRCLALAQQQLRPGTEVIIDGAGEQVRHALRLSGLDRSMTVVAGR